MVGVSVAGIFDIRAAIAVLLAAGRLAFMDRNMNRQSTVDGRAGIAKSDRRQTRGWLVAGNSRPDS